MLFEVRLEVIAEVRPVATVGHERGGEPVCGELVLALLGPGEGGGMFFFGAANASRTDRIEVEQQAAALGDLVIRRGLPGSALDAIRCSCQQITLREFATSVLGEQLVSPQPGLV